MVVIDVCKHFVLLIKRRVLEIFSLFQCFFSKRLKVSMKFVTNIKVSASDEIIVLLHLAVLL